MNSVVPGSLAAPASAAAIAMSTVTTGRTIPSFKPLSTLRFCRTRIGRRLSLTTAWPSAASVGASTAASSAASTRLRPSKSSTATTVPATMVSGSEMPSRRDGVPDSLRKTRRSMSTASVNNTSTRVASTRIAMVSPSMSRSNQPRPPIPQMIPIVVNTIGAVMGDIEERCDTMA